MRMFVRVRVCVTHTHTHTNTHEHDTGGCDEHQIRSGIRERVRGCQAPKHRCGCVVCARAAGRARVRACACEQNNYSHLLDTHTHIHTPRTCPPPAHARVGSLSHTYILSYTPALSLAYYPARVLGGGVGGGNSEPLHVVLPAWSGPGPDVVGAGSGPVFEHHARSFAHASGQGASLSGKRVCVCVCVRVRVRVRSPSCTNPYA